MGKIILIFAYLPISNKVKVNNDLEECKAKTKTIICRKLDELYQTLCNF